MVILVDGPAYRRKAVVTVGQDIGKRKLLHSGGFGGLNDTYERNVVGSHRVKTQTQVLHIRREVMGFQDRPGDGAFPVLGPVCISAAERPDLFRLLFRYELSAVYEIDASVI